MKKLLKAVITSASISLMALAVCTSVQAKTPTLSKTSIGLKVGCSTKLKVKNNKAKIKWSSSNKNIASVDSKGKVKANKIGYCVIYAKVKKPKIKLSCSVRVSVNQEKLESNIDYTEELTKTDKMVVYIKNKNNFNVRVKCTIAYFDENSNLISSDSDSYVYVASKQTAVATVYYPKDENYNLVPFRTYNVSIDAEYDSSINCASDIEMKYNYSPSGIAITAINNSDKELEFIYYICISRDNEGKIIDTEWGYLDCKKPNSQAYATEYYPTDSDYNDVIPAYSEIIINHAR